jgi:fructose-bisphosphate aldolase class 1
MAHVYSIQSSSSSSSISVSRFTTRKQFFAVFLGSSILLSIILITSILCFLDRLHKKFRKKKSLIKTNNLVNGKRIASSSPTKSRFCYEGDSPTHHYTNLKFLQPVIVVASSSSQSSSTSVDSTTRMNTTHNRTTNSTYSYTAMVTSDELMPDNDDNDDMNSGIELMMTTV